MSKQPVQQYIAEVESNRDPIENPITDIKSYIQMHQLNQPKLTGPKAFSLTGTLREQDDSEEQSPPEVGISPSSILDDEL